MAENPYTGLTAAIKADDTVLAYMNNLELNLSRTIIEILQFGAQYKQKAPGMKNWTASVEGTVAFDTTGGQKALVDKFESGEDVELQIQLKNGTYFEGNALIASLSISGTPDDALTISAEFEGNGAVVFTPGTSSTPGDDDGE